MGGLSLLPTSQRETRHAEDERSRGTEGRIPPLPEEGSRSRPSARAFRRELGSQIVLPGGQRQGQDADNTRDGTGCRENHPRHGEAELYSLQKHPGVFLRALVWGEEEAGIAALDLQLVKPRPRDGESPPQSHTACQRPR